MKFKKIYHALTADLKNKWKESWHETVDVDQSHAEEENKNFDLTGVKYEAVEISDAPPLEHTSAINGSAESVTESHLNDDVLSAQKDIVEPTEVKEKVAAPVVETPTKEIAKRILTEEDFTTHPELKDAGFQIGDEVDLQEDGSFVGSSNTETPIKHIVTEQDLIDNPDLAVDGVKVGDEIELPKVTPQQ